MATAAGNNTAMPKTTAAAATAATSAHGQGEQASPRKRRRRAPTTGAADDCFTCRDRGVTCDRRRPYCSQCLDMKTTCSGYKTQLTWGVGVASRGKLRGLSLPVAKSKAASSLPTEKQSAAAAKAAVTTTATTTAATTAPVSTSKKNSATSTPTSASNRTKAQKTPSKPDITSQPLQQPTPAPSTISVSSVPVSYAFVGAGLEAPVQSAPPFQTNFEWPSSPKYASSDLRHQPLQTDGPAGDTGNGAYERPLKRQALHLDTTDIHSYPVHNAYPMSAAPALGHDYSARAYNSPISPYQARGFEHGHVRHGSFSSQQGSGQYRFSGQRSIHHQQPVSVGSPHHWSTGYPSPSAGSDHGSYVSTPDQAFSSGGLSDPAIGMAADQLLAMQYPQTHFFPQASFGTMYRSVEAIQEADEEDVEDIGRGDAGMGFWGGDLIRMNQTFASQEKVGNTPELRYLINYYLEVLTPVIIAFDGAGNPWREHILSLARHNEGLQHAIAALSASNLRMRREHKHDRPRLPPTGDSAHDVAVRRSSEAHERLNDEVDPPQLSKPGAPSKREARHKAEAVRALNMQLEDPNGRSDDSILAILLVLCLYHMCETGVARFKTQFAGVKKIMAMRDVKKASSKEINWILTFFKWFDAMAATVNDRESQFAVEPSFPSDDQEWGLENLAGCDSQLFAIVNKLGRLNVLSQGREPSLSPAGAGMTPPPFFSPVAGPHGAHLHPDLIFDGNGWAQMAASPGGMDAHAQHPHDAHDLRTQQFWAEWSQVRQQLTAWHFDPSYLPGPMRVAAQQMRQGSATSSASMSSSSTLQFADASIADISNISESFRHAALLYTERLAYPAMAPEHPRLQGMVITALHYIRLVKSDVCLLWPLFIVGAECVHDDHRSVVRTRCWDIQKDSGFFNNIKCLELLEVIWDKADQAKRIRLASGGWDMTPPDSEVFKWRKEMKSAEGEYIVI